MKLLAQIERYQPNSSEQKRAKAALLKDLQAKGDLLFLRENTEIHITASAIILNETFTSMLMLYHNIYKAYTFPGGHADGEQDLIAIAKKEIAEETGLVNFYLYANEILSIEVLPVVAHNRKDEIVTAHKHYNVTFGFVASGKEKLIVKEDENTAVQWVAIDELGIIETEPHMLPIYKNGILRMQEVCSQKQAIFAKLPKALVPWYKENKRDLPWRNDKEPYHVWISEIMLQQTRVETVKAYYIRFIAALPTIADLAMAQEGVLLKLWEGLGYYSRVRNMQRAAQLIMDKYDGHFPKLYEDVLELPGIGAYTAGAICSICYEMPTPAVDGNVLRVIARATQAYEPINRPSLKNWVTEELAVVYPIGHCGDFTQALMELGAMVCTPRSPKCAACPLQSSCLAKRNDVQNDLPVRPTKPKRKKETYTVFILEIEDKIAVCKRGQKGVLAGMWELPNVSGELRVEEALMLVKEWGVAPIGIEKQLHKKHIFTHIQWDMVGYYITCANEVEKFTWVDEATFAKSVGLPTAFRKFINE